MTNFLKRLALRLAPRPARFVRDAILTLNGWRFDDLKSHTVQALRTETHQVAIASDSMKRLEQPVSPETRLAVVSALPPDDTGIANFTLQTFRAAGYPVDIFARFASLGSYLSLEYNSDLRRDGLNFFSLETLPAARAQRNYMAEIYEIGNSNHNIPIMDALARRGDCATDVPVFVHIHDPCLMNLLREFLAFRGRNFIHVLSEAYGLDPSACLNEIARGGYDPLVQRGLLGPRALFRNLPITGIITNSSAASDLIARDWPDLRPDRLHTLFHPVFPPSDDVRPRQLHGAIRIGTFGIPSTSKCSELIVSAFVRLSREIHGIELVIAGYNAGPFASSQGIAGCKNIIVEDAPSDSRLFELMQSCQLAVQLRRNNLGESSGIIPQLIALGVPVITSRIGAFAEYGDAVAYAEPGCGVEELAELIKRELRNAGLRDMAQRTYAAERTPTAFCQALEVLIRTAARSDEKEPSRYE